MNDRPGRRSSHKRIWRFAATFGVCILLGAVGSVAAHDPIKTRVTWTGDIARIMSARCVSCHYPGVEGTMSLSTYEEARPWARAIKEEVLTRRMPKWHAVRGYGDFANDPSLSAFDIALVSAWVDGGAPKGTDADVVGSGTGVATRRLAADRPAGARDVTVPCGDQPAPEGLLWAVRPVLEKDGTVGIAVKLPGQRLEIVGWIRGYDPQSPTTYQLRVPLALPPTSVISAQPSSAGCRLTLTVLPQ